VSLFGAVLAQGNQAGVSSLTLEAGDHVFLGVGDADVKDLDLVLQDGGGTRWRRTRFWTRSRSSPTRQTEARTTSSPAPRDVGDLDVCPVRDTDAQ